jgi:hypothetical protein
VPLRAAREDGVFAAPGGLELAGDRGGDRCRSLFRDRNFTLWLRGDVGTATIAVAEDVKEHPRPQTDKRAPVAKAKPRVIGDESALLASRPKSRPYAIGGLLATCKPSAPATTTSNTKRPVSPTRPRRHYPPDITIRTHLRPSARRPTHRHDQCCRRRRPTTVLIDRVRSLVAVALRGRERPFLEGGASTVGVE